MATQAPVTAGIEHTAPRRIWLEVLHDWVTTVDHKKIGLMYIGYALIFLVIAGFEALLMRVQLAVPNNHFVSPAGLQSALHHARHHHGLLRRDAHPLRLRQLPYPADDRRPRHGLPAAERLQLLDLGLRRLAALLQLPRRQRTLRRGQRARRGLVGLCAAHRPGIFSRPQHRLLDPRHPAQRHRHHRHGGQYRRHHHLHALPRHEAQPHAAAGLALPGHVLPGLRHHQPAHRRADHADARPLRRLPLLRHPGRRLGRAVDALLLDLRPSRGLRPGAARLRLRQRDHPRLLAQGHLRLSRRWSRPRSASASSASASGPTTCSPSA